MLTPSRKTTAPGPDAAPSTGAEPAAVAPAAAPSTAVAPAAEPADTRPPAAEPPGAVRRRKVALVVVMTAAFMDLVDATIVNIALPTIRRDLGASYSALQWITAGYALAFAVGLISGGRLGDIHGRRRVFLFGVGGFTLASALCGLAGGPEVLIAARLLQGATAALMVPQVLAIVHATFPAGERGRVIGVFGAVMGLGAVSGPLIGALLLESGLFGLEWQLIFLVNLPVGVAVLVLGRRCLTESSSPRAQRLDPVGTALVSAGLLMLLYPLTQGRESGWPLWGFGLMAASVPVLGLFVHHQRLRTRGNRSPLVVLALFRVRSFAAGIGVQLVFGAVCGVFFLVWTLYLQLGLGWGPLKAGLAGVPFALGASVSAAISIRSLVPRFGRRVLQAGPLVMIAGALLCLVAVDRYGLDVRPWHLTVPFWVMGAGMGLVFAPLANAVLSGVPREDSGSASGLFNTVNQVGLTLGMGLTSVTFFAVVDEGAAAGRAVDVSHADAFTHSLWWVIGGLAVSYALTFALPGRGTPPDDPGREESGHTGSTGPGGGPDPDSDPGR